MTDGDSMTINNLRDSANGTFVTLDDYFPLVCIVYVLCMNCVCIVYVLCMYCSRTKVRGLKTLTVVSTKNHAD